MNELVKLVSQKTGLPEAQAKMAVEVVLGYLKDKLPSPLASQIDNVLSGSDISDNLGGITKGLGGLLG